MKNLRYLELEANIWADDLAFLQNLPNVEVLILDGNAHLDLSHFNVPKSVKCIQVPSYAVKELRKTVGNRCHVIAGYCLYGKDKYRFIRPEERKRQEEDAKLLASLKRRIANVQSAMEQLMSAEQLIPELSMQPGYLCYTNFIAALIAQLTSHLHELEKIIEGQAMEKSNED